MDNRLSGLIIVVVALFFLWLYDTGKWAQVKAAIQGVPANQLGSAALNVSSELTGGFGTQSGGLGAGTSLVASVCKKWPAACPFTSGGLFGSGGGTEFDYGSVFGDLSGFQDAGESFDFGGDFGD